MDATRNVAQRGASAAQTGKRVISDAAAQAWAAIITVAVFSGVAVVLNAWFERLAGA